MFKVLDEVCTPKRATKYSAYVDLFAREDVVIGAGETKIVKLGVKIDSEKLKQIQLIGAFGSIEDFLSRHYIEVALRSSLGVKGLIIANGIGIIDLDYPDEIGLIVHNPVNLDVVDLSAKLIVMSDKLGGYGLSTEEITEALLDFSKDNEEKRKKVVIKKADKVAQCTLKEHKGYLMGYESDTIRTGGFGSTNANNK